jgi:TPR repeat protein
MFVVLLFGESNYKLGHESYEKKDYKKAFYYLEKSCHLGTEDSSFFACQDIGHIFNESFIDKEINKIIPKNEKLARLYWEKSCELGNNEGCMYYNNKYFEIGNLNLYPGGYEEAFNYFKKSCDTNESNHVAESCYNVAQFYSHLFQPNTVILDNIKAIKYWTKACSFDHADACGNLSHHKKGFDKLRFALKGCNLDSGESCNSYAVIVQDVWDKTYESKSKIIKFFEKACNLNSKRGCYNLSYMYFERGYKQKAYISANKACELGHKKACKVKDKIRE